MQIWRTMRKGKISERMVHFAVTSRMTRRIDLLCPIWNWYEEELSRLRVNRGVPPTVRLINSDTNQDRSHGSYPMTLKSQDKSITCQWAAAKESPKVKSRSPFQGCGFLRLSYWPSYISFTPSTKAFSLRLREG
jgi:hypothetical protein